MKTTKVIRLADLFCGAGGTTTGAVEAVQGLGFRADVTAINHWPIAVETHSANHPDARHLCASLDSVNPRDLYNEGELDVLLASPECMSHSNARGGRPVNDQSRATAWCVLRWADALRPPVILIENVPEFEHWAPIGSNGRPLKSKRGQVFQAWIDALKSLGYKVGWRVLCAADYGDPTTRRRLFIQAVRGMRRIVWPHATHSGDQSPALFGQLKPWVAARQILDLSKKGTSIFNRKRPLSSKTMARILEGAEKFWPEPFVVALRGTAADQISRSARSVDQPAPTVATGNHLYLAEPFLVAMEHGGRVISANDPLPTVTCAKGGAFGVAEPFLVQTCHEGNDASRVRDVNKPLPAVCGNRGDWAVCEAFTVGAGGPTGSSRPSPVSEPLGTVLAHDRRALVQPFIVPNFGERDGQNPRVHGIDDPLPTVTSRGAGNLIQPLLIPQQSGGELRPVSEPAPTVATSGAIAVVEPVLIEFYGNGQAQKISDPLPTVTTKDRFGLARPVIIANGKRYEIDILFRMLQPAELAGAQGFPATYRFVGTKTETVKQIGNAVPRRLARALVAAVLQQDPDVSRIVDIDVVEKGAAA